MKPTKNPTEMIRFKNILDELNINYQQIILFGSRVKNIQTADSDWDFLIVLKHSLEDKEKRSLKALLRVQFHSYFPLSPIDIVLKDAITFEKEKEIANTMSNEAYLEGISA
ncbi:MAG: nucleotidyltransferase domain-containing protein [Spirochaetes bacterium]|nr:nucleotidyltransferase domain-containing protein [Spirochaetota bacterium]